MLCLGVHCYPEVSWRGRGITGALPKVKPSRDWEGNGTERDPNVSPQPLCCIMPLSPVPRELIAVVRSEDPGDKFQPTGQDNTLKTEVQVLAGDGVRNDWIHLLISWSLSGDQEKTGRPL